MIYYKSIMNTRTALNCVIIILATIYVPLGLIQWYLVLNAIHASSLLWFLYIVGIPFAIAISILTKLVEIIRDNGKDKA